MLTFVWGHQRRCQYHSLWRMLTNHSNVFSFTLVQDTRCFSMNGSWNNHAALLCEDQIAQLTSFHRKFCHLIRKPAAQTTYTVFDVYGHHQGWTAHIRCDWDSNDRTHSVATEMAVKHMWPWTVSVLSWTIQVFFSLFVNHFNDDRIQSKRRGGICLATVNTDPVGGSTIRVYSWQLAEHYLHNDHTCMCLHMYSSACVVYRLEEKTEYGFLQ